MAAPGATEGRFILSINNVPEIRAGVLGKLLRLECLLDDLAALDDEDGPLGVDPLKLDAGFWLLIPCPECRRSESVVGGPYSPEQRVRLSAPRDDADVVSELAPELS